MSGSSRLDLDWCYDAGRCSWVSWSGFSWPLAGRVAELCTRVWLSSRGCFLRSLCCVDVPCHHSCSTAPIHTGCDVRAVGLLVVASTFPVWLCAPNLNCTLAVGRAGPQLGCGVNNLNDQLGPVCVVQSCHEMPTQGPLADCKMHPLWWCLRDPAPGLVLPLARFTDT